MSNSSSQQCRNRWPRKLLGQLWVMMGPDRTLSPEPQCRWLGRGGHSWARQYPALSRRNQTEVPAEVQGMGRAQEGE